MCNTLLAQGLFIETQKSFSKPSVAFSHFEDSLQKQFDAKKLSWPPRYMYVRSFKYDRQLEVWVKGDKKEQYKLFKTYKVCMQSGTLGPKRFEGDFQVPEGFYHINEFNPNSNYHLSLGLNYPNASDKILSDAEKPGSAIYIHGNCVSTGCLAITDLPIEELYVMGSYVKDAGQEFIPVHIYPIRYNQKKGEEYLQETIKNNPAIEKFSNNLKEVFNYFEAKKNLPIILINEAGEYLIN
ncbi:MAG: L,D-transpeptidase family protein [Ferruginibacter sp.]|nr:L,D-transpeptidase family protein [Ferruginibacter sp.]